MDEEDVLERVESTRFLGPEFLLWLWLRAEIVDKPIALPEFGDFDVWLDNQITLQSDIDPNERVTVRGAAPSGSPEAREAVRAQKFPVRARIAIRNEERDFACVLVAHRFAVASGKIPAVLTKDTDDAFQERMTLVERLSQSLDGLYAAFLRDRLSALWKEAWEPAIVSWADDDAHSGGRARAADARQAHPQQESQIALTVAKDRSTLLTSPLSMADFVARLAFFAIAPFAIVLAAELFPVRGALIDVGLALFVFMLGEAPRRVASRFRPIGSCCARRSPSRATTANGSRAASRTTWPTRCCFRIGCPIARRATSFGCSAATPWQASRSCSARSAGNISALGGRSSASATFLPAVLLSLGVETLLVLSLLMPIATTVVWYHGSFRRRRLLVILLVGALSTSYALSRVLSHRDPIVSYLTRERVRLRTAAARRSAHRALQNAVEVAWRDLVKEARGAGRRQGRRQGAG